MKTRMFVANLIVQGKLDIEGAEVIKTWSQSVDAMAGSRYLDSYELDSERLGPDKYEVELDRCEFTVEEIQAYIAGDFPTEHMAYEMARREAVARVSELIEQVSPAMSELLTLANEFNIPANIKVGKYTNDYRLIDAVDWDSSSMYC
ncbi:hypothetical protein 16Q_121 [Pseudomonas phage 16Q]|nr:hypothetical protein 16Q_121 [Pseudomonas phage 16Q]